MRNNRRDERDGFMGDRWEGPTAGYREYGIGPTVIEPHLYYSMDKGQMSSPARFRPEYKRPTSVPTRVAEWEKWKKSLQDEEGDPKSGLKKGKGCPVSVDLTNLKYNPLPSQYRFHASNRKYKGFSGSIGSGKSKAMVYESLFLSAISPNCAGYITAPTHPMLRDAAQTAFFEMLQEEGVEYDFKGGEYNVVTFKAGDPNFDITNGQMTPSQVYFRTASHPDRLRGPNIAWYAMDELTYSDEDAWKILLGRIRHPRANQHNGFGCWTPRGFDWVWKMFLDSPAEDTELIRSVPRENVHLPSGFYDSVRAQYDPELAKQELEGEYLELYQGQVYYSYSRKYNLDESINYIPGHPIMWAIDFNVNPFCSVVCQYVDGPDLGTKNHYIIKPWSEVWVFDEVVLREANTFQLAEAFLRKAQPWLDKERNRITVQLYGDASGDSEHTSSAHGSDWKILRDWFAQHSDEFKVEWNIPRSNPPIRARVNAMNAALCDANGTRRLKINPRCTTLINDLQTVTWLPGAKGEHEANMYVGKKKELTHISDALGYAVVQFADFYGKLSYERRRLVGF